MQKILSICLLVYNHDHILKPTIESILTEIEEQYEFLISDDCSSDNSWEIILDYAKRYHYIKAYRTEKNLGMAGNTNYLVSKATGKYISLLHHDDFVQRGLFKKALAVISKNEKVGFVFNDYLIDGIADHKKENRKFDEIMNGNSFFEIIFIKRMGLPC